MKNNAALVEFKNIFKSFGEQNVFRGLNVQIPQGKLSFIIGRSGEGKSVLLKHIVGILHPDQGQILFEDIPMSAASPQEWIEARRKIGILFQDGALIDGLDVFENICLGLREFESHSTEELLLHCNELLCSVGLPSDILYRHPYELSIGEKKRVGLARALSLKPRLLLYDEPTTSMDPLLAERIDALIMETHKSRHGITSVVVSHDVRSVMNLAEHIIFLHRGVVYAQGTPQDFDSSTDGMVRQFMSGSRHGPLTDL